MATTRKIIGRLSQYLGDWVEGKSYKKRNRVTIYGSEFESKIDNNQSRPATFNELDNTIVVNENWQIISDARAAWILARKTSGVASDSTCEAIIDELS